MMRTIRMMQDAGCFWGVAAFLFESRGQAWIHGERIGGFSI